MDEMLDVKVIPAQMIRDYNKGFTLEEIAQRWKLTTYYARKILLERGVEWKHPESR